MNTLHLGRHLGDVSTRAFQRFHQSQLLNTLEHNDTVVFNVIRLPADNAGSEIAIKPRAHTAGTNCLAIDPQQGRFIASGGADSTVRLWDLEKVDSESSRPESQHVNHSPVATLARAFQNSHTHALTSVSIYPFDPVATTLLTTSFDKTLLVSHLSPTNLQPVHKFELDFTPYTHTISPIPSATPLVAVGTAHPAIRLLDLRSGLATHSLPGHNAAVYALQFSPRHEHILVSGSADGRILVFDIRRANPAFASFDLDDAVGLTSNPQESRPLNLHLNFNSQAHAGAVTGLTIPSPDPTKLISAGHDQRIRVWDFNTGRNELVHFGPRIRNSRAGNLTPVVAPHGYCKPGQEEVFWPNDDSRGEIFVHSMREGQLLSIMKTKGVDRSNVTQSNITKMTSGGRINGLVFRANAEAGSAFEMYSAHGDGRICAWFPKPEADTDEEVDLRNTELDVPEDELTWAERNKKKRKRDLIGGLVEGLTKKPISFS